MQSMPILCDLFYKIQGLLKEQFVLSFSDTIENLPQDHDPSYK